MEQSSYYCKEPAEHGRMTKGEFKVNIYSRHLKSKMKRKEKLRGFGVSGRMTVAKWLWERFLLVMYNV
jgi:hypothetical protein